MSSHSNEPATIRQYLLGQLAGEAREGFEQRLLTQDDAFSQLLAGEDELLDEYLTGSLEPDEAEMFAKHFLNSHERQQSLRFAKAFKKYAALHAPEESQPQLERTSSRSTWWPRFTASPWPALALAAAILLAATAVWRVFIYRSDVDKGLIALNNAYKEQRPLESRITKLDYAPFVTTRGGETARFDSRERDVAERYLLDAVRDHPGGPAYHALGKFYLAERNFDKAIANFEAGLKADPNNARLHSDLGAALLEKGKADRLGDDPGKGFAELAKSLEDLNKALELDSSLLEAFFNRALVHEEMVLPEQAKEDWQKYLEKDSKSEWADEARQHLAQFERRSQNDSRNKEDRLQAFLNTYQTGDVDGAWDIVRRSRDASAVGTLIRDQLIDESLQGSSKGETRDTTRQFPALTFLGKVELQETGDVYTSELARFYTLSSPHQREVLTKARGLMKEGREYQAKARPLEAMAAFDKARLLFKESGDRWEAQYSELWVGYSHLSASDNQQSLKILEQLASSFEQQNYKWLLMRTLHLLSGAEYNLSEYSTAIEHNHRSFAIAEQMGDTIGAFNPLTILIEQYRHIGNYGQALDCIRRSLSLLDSCPLSQNQIGQYYGNVATLLASSNLYAAAADYQKEAIKRALTTGQIQTISRAYVNLGAIYGKMGYYNQALENARRGYDIAKSHSDESVRKGLMAYSSRQLGDLYKQFGDISRAIESYDESIEINKSLDNYYGLYEAHKNRLSCYTILGNDPAVKEELTTTLALIEKYRSKILEGDNRNHFFDSEQGVYDLAIDFEYSRMNNPQKAFEYSETSRSRSLLDLANSNARVSNDVSGPDLVFGRLSQPLSLSEIQQRIPAQAQLLQYSVLNDKVLIWLISRTAFSCVETKVPKEELDRRVLRYLQSISSGPSQQTAEGTDDAMQLFDILIKPVEPLLEKGKPIYVVPDKVLNYLPFGTLMSSDSHRFLLQDYSTVVSPSSSLFILSSEIARKKEGKNIERVLSVGNPNFDRSKFPTLAELPSAAREAENVASYYDSKCLLTGQAARKPRIEMEMQKADVIHLAVHTVFDQHSPLRSKLLLARESGSPVTEAPSGDVLEASEIYNMKLPLTRVVVLSACQSGVEQYFAGEGMISLARPFLAASVPLVVVSFWPVDSDSTAELMSRFHKYRKQDKFASAEALRRAQLDMLSSEDERLRQPYCWASFTAVGGWTTF